MELFTQMRDQIRDGSPHPGSGGGSGSGSGSVGHPGRSLSSAANLTSLCVDISPSTSHFFEVSPGRRQSIFKVLLERAAAACGFRCLCPDLALCLVQVLYIGKIKVSHRKVPESFIDDALEKFRLHDLEKEKEKGRLVENAGKAILMRNNSSSRIVPPGGMAAVAAVSERRGSQVRTGPGGVDQKEPA